MGSLSSATHGFRSIYHLFDLFPLWAADQDRIRHLVSSTAFSVLARITIGSRLLLSGLHVKWNKKPASPPWQAFFSLNTTVLVKRVQPDHGLVASRCIFFSSAFFPFPSLPPYLDAVWKQATFRDTPLGTETLRKWLSRLLGTLSSTPGSAGCAVARRSARRAKGREAGQIGRGRMFGRKGAVHGN